MVENDYNIIVCLQWVCALFPRPQQVGPYHYGDVVDGHLGNLRVERELIEESHEVLEVGKVGLW